ncbi:unnamed protein product [Tetraodon nigroviridis]|uniref:Chromosome 5 SCAF14581, whole genome shotgun sequence n=1 Tax=Tetraodon nigroviridis TaxID=99883 RepID=Q4SHD0_TETNG|nr:unnamed protein product [Tetraodon nigroviridis]
MESADREGRERVCLGASAQRRIKGLCSASQWTSGHQY